MSWQSAFEKWNNENSLDADLRKQLEVLSRDPILLEDCFYKNLEFGTGGMRGEIGPGTNRMNLYTVRKASQGLADFIKKQGEKAQKRGVVIAYDSRHQSPEFAMEAARTLATNGIQTYVFEGLRPTPELSFAVRYLKAYGGIVITASHNPPEYNGYKVYGPDGGQLPPKEADEVIEHVNSVENELAIHVLTEQELKEQSLIQMVGEEIDEAYIEQLKKIRLNPGVIEEMHDISIVFTPLHGTALHPVQNGLKAFGFTNVITVNEQAQPDPNFSTVKSPNPEEHAAFEIAIQYGEKHKADVLLATDPDADRVGVAVKLPNGQYSVLTGNQTGALMLEYLLSQRKEKGMLPPNGIVFKTIVTSELGRAISSFYGLATEDTLTGFKFIGEKIKEYEKTGEYAFLFGYEESYGSLIGDFVRDKDAVQACLMAAEMAAFYKKQGKTLYQAMMDVYEKYGFYMEGLESLTLKGKAGAEQIEGILASFRLEPPKDAAGTSVVAAEDYKTSERIDLTNGQVTKIELPSSNVLKYFLEDGSWFCIRPSGTEPKVKFYFGVQAASKDECELKLQKIREAVMNVVHEKIQSTVN